jgi:hypothetical protein
MGRLFALAVGICVVCVLALAAVGCAQLAGIDNTSHFGDTIAVTRMSVGATVEKAPQDLTGQEATYFVASSDPSAFDRVAATLNPARDRWTSKLRAPAPVLFTLPDVPKPIPRMFAFPSSQLSVLYGVLEHPSPSPAPDGAMLTLTVPLDTLPAVGETFQSFVVGAWLVRNFPAGEIVATGMQLTPPAFGFVPGNSASGRPQVDRITMADALLVLRYVGATLTGVAEAMPFEQTDAATAVTTRTMAPVAPDQVLSVKVSPGALAARYTKAQPAVANLMMNWSLVAAPGYQIASNAGPVLTSGSVMAMDTAVMAKYGNPFAAAPRSWHTIFTLATVESRSFQLPGTMAPTPAVDLFAGMNQFIEPSPDFDMNLPAGLPIVISLDDVPLVTDGQSVKQPGKFVTVSFSVNPAPGVTGPSATLYNLQVFDLVPNATTMAPERHLTFAAAGNRSEFALPPEVFQAGHFYTVRAIATLGGFPAIDDGNFLERELPLAQSYLDSAVIAVMP